MADDYPREKRENEDQREIVISDRRHSRNLPEETEEQPAVEAEKPAGTRKDQPAAEPVAGDTGGVVEFRPPQHEDAAPAELPAEESAEPVTQRTELPDDSPEAAQLRMLFEFGLPAYLHSQLQLLLNFAMIYLGRQPNPATGLVSKDNGNARLAIDLFEFIVTRTSDELPEQDRTGLANLVAGLKMEFAQSLQNNAKPGGEPDGH